MLIASNVAGRRERLRLMREGVRALGANPDLAFLRLHLIASCIDGLVKAPRGKARLLYLEYIRLHFPGLHAAVGAEAFYDHVRCAAVHEFAPRPPFALGRGLPDGPYETTETVAGSAWRILNLDRIEADFLSHLSALERQPQGQPNNALQRTRCARR